LENAPAAAYRYRRREAVVDVSGERFVDHEAEVRAWFSID
jgi:hypothetical protein